MKKLSEIKHNYANSLGYNTWTGLLSNEEYINLIDEHYNSVSKEYAYEVAKEALKNASACNVIYVDTVDENGEETTGKVIYQDDILSEINIPKEVRG